MNGPTWTDRRVYHVFEAEWFLRVCHVKLSTLNWSTNHRWADRVESESVVRPNLSTNGCPLVDLSQGSKGSHAQQVSPMQARQLLSLIGSDTPNFARNIQVTGSETSRCQTLKERELSL
jgi:hypothetical protein